MLLLNAFCRNFISLVILKINIYESKIIGITRPYSIGTWSWLYGHGEFYGQTDDTESIKTIHRAIELGITFLDTADAYGPHKMKYLLAKAIKGFRDKITSQPNLVSCATPMTDETGLNGKPAYVKSPCKQA